MSQAATAPAIEVSGLTKRFGERTVVDGVDLSVMRGRICGFLGPNGSGKTTTIRLLCGLLRPDAGSGRCLGLDIRKQGLAIRRQVGYMTQRFGLYDDLSIRENLDFVGRLYEIAGRRQAVDATLDQLGLAGRQHQLAGTLSGGWKQRLALAACLLHKPQLLLLDEPTAGVDPKARRDFWDQIHGLAAQGITVLVSTHYMDEAERCHDLAFIAYGRLLARGTEREILARSGLSVWRLRARDAAQLAAIVAPLQAQPGVSSVAAFGHVLHVSADSAEAVQQALAAIHPPADLSSEPAEPNLEDVFISLIGRTPDPMGARTS